MSYSVEEVLNYINLIEYLPNFHNNDITDLHTVDEALLINIGIDKIGHRKRILSELSKLYGIGSKAYKTDDFESNVSDDEIAPPLPPKLKPHPTPTPREVPTSHPTNNKNVGSSGENISPNKPRPVKPPRRTAPGSVIKPIQPVNNQPQQPPTLPERPPIRTSFSDSSIGIVQECTVSIPQSRTSIHNETFIPESTTQSIFRPSIPQPYDGSSLQSLPPSLIFPPPPSHPPPPTPYEDPSLKSFSLRRNDEQIKLPPRPATSMMSERPIIPPRDYHSNDGLVHTASISKSERTLKAKSVDLMSFNEDDMKAQEGIIKVNERPRSKTVKLKKSNTMETNDNKMEIALRRAKQNLELNIDKEHNRKSLMNSRFDGPRSRVPQCQYDGKFCAVDLHKFTKFILRIF